MQLFFAVLFAVLIPSMSSTLSSLALKQKVKGYLKKFGYVEDEQPMVSKQKTRYLPSNELEKALREFQRFVGLVPTGKMDRATLAKMNTPRCGVKDKHPDQGFISNNVLLRTSGQRPRSARKMHYEVSHPWDKMFLTYTISKHSKILTDKNAVRNEVARAFQVWSEVTPLRFEERISGAVDIQLSFEVGNHGDGDENAFDNRNGILAHADPPLEPTSFICFDDDEEWTFAGPYGTNFFQTAVHEIGHSLGLDHSEVTESVMYPYETGYQENFALHEDDIKGIQFLYGSTPVPDMCHGSSIDTVTSTKDGKTYFFRGPYYWELSETGNGFAKGYPRRISKDWTGLPDDLDASFYWSSKGNTYFFKGTQYWKFTNKDPIPGYPRLISEGFKNMPNSPDAVFRWKGSGFIYFLKDDKYWRFIKRKNKTGPFHQPMSDFKGLPYYVDAAFQGWNGFSYIFKCDRYYRLNNKILKVETEHKYPRSTAMEWFGCDEQRF